MSSREKIDSVYDFTEKGLVEVKAWLEPWFKTEPAEGGDGIQFDTFPQEGGYLVVTTTATESATGITIEDEGNGGITIDSWGGGGIRMREQSDGGMIISSNGGGLILEESTGGMAIASDGGGGLTISADPYGVIAFGSIEGIRIAPHTGDTLRLSHIPTSDPHVVDAVWNDGGTLKISAG